MSRPPLDLAPLDLVPLNLAPLNLAHKETRISKGIITSLPNTLS